MSYGTATVELHKKFIEELRKRTDIEILDVGQFDHLDIALCVVSSPLLKPGYNFSVEIIKDGDTIRFKPWTDTDIGAGRDPDVG